MFNIIISSLSPTKVAMTFPFSFSVYLIEAVGATLSIQFTSAMCSLASSSDCPLALYSNANFPLLSNTCVSLLPTIIASDYTFTKNGEFTFLFEDLAGNTGRATAKVDSIKEETTDPDQPSEPEKYVCFNCRHNTFICQMSYIVFYVTDNYRIVIFIIGFDTFISNIVCFVEHLKFVIPTLFKGVFQWICYRFLKSGNIFKTVYIDESGNITKIAYVNTSGNVASVNTYVTTMTNGVVSKEEYLDSHGTAVTITDAEKDILRGLQKPITDPLLVNPVNFCYCRSCNSIFIFKLECKCSIFFEDICIRTIEWN